MFTVRQSWYLALGTVGTMSSLLVAGVLYLDSRIAELQQTRTALKDEVASIRAGWTQTATAGAEVDEPRTNPAPPCRSSSDQVAEESLRKDLDRIARAVAKIQSTVETLSAAPMPVESMTAFHRNFPALPGIPHPFYDDVPGQGMTPEDAASREARAHMDSVFRDLRMRARERIELLSTDPTQPDLDVVTQVMEETDEDLAAELRAAVSREEFEALFPPGPGQR
jgi:hypothetical protein